MLAQHSIELQISMAISVHSLTIYKNKKFIFQKYLNSEVGLGTNLMMDCVWRVLTSSVLYIVDKPGDLYLTLALNITGQKQSINEIFVCDKTTDAWVDWGCWGHRHVGTGRFLGASLSVTARVGTLVLMTALWVSLFICIHLEVYSKLHSGHHSF